MDDWHVTATPEIAAYAADIRRRHAAKPPKVRVEIRRIARRAAGDIAKDLPGLDREQLGAVLLRVGAFGHNLAAARPDATVWEIAALLDAAGEYLFHHAGETEPECEA